MKWWRSWFLGLTALSLIGWPASTDWLPQAHAGAGTVSAPRKSAGAKPRTRRIRRSKVTHKIVGGDTLARVAKKYGVTIAQIKAWNPSLKGNSLVKGRSLVIWVARSPAASRRTTKTHTVKKGETLASIADKYNVSIRDLQAWNPKVKPRTLRPGTTLKLYKRIPAGDSNSSGTAQAGRLEGGIAMQSGKGYRVRNPSRAYGTVTAVTLIDRCISDTKSKYRRAHDLWIGDLSYKAGGHMPPHKSHQSGRDADISYYMRRVDNPYRFNVATPRNLDVVKTWYLFEKFLATGKVSYIFVDYPLQKVLYEHARKRGKSKAYLDKVFQYPQGRGSSRGIIRYSRGHDDHFHIRFKCDSDDKKCR